MIEGEILSEGTTNPDLSLLEDLVLGVGPSSPILFRAAGAAAEVINICSGNPAYRCESCGHVLINTDPEFTDIECLVCRTAMLAGTTSCPRCGWTYKEENGASS